MPRIVIDNTAPQFVFDDSQQDSAGAMRALANIFRTPHDVAQLKGQQKAQQDEFDHRTQQEQLAQAWKEKEFDRQAFMDQNKLDAEQQAQATAAMKEMFAGQDRQATNDYQNKRLDIDQQVANDHRNQAWRDDMGSVLKGLGEQFFGKPSAQRTNAGTGWHQSSDGKFFRTTETGMMEIYDPETKQTMRQDTNAPPSSAPVKPTFDQPSAPMVAPSSGMRPSGKPGINSLGDLLGLRWFGNGGQPAAAAPTAATGKGVDAKTLQDYAAKYGMDPAEAAKHLSEQGYAVQGVGQ